MSDELVHVRILGFPIDVWRLSDEHFADLSREFSLIALQDPDERAHAVPRRLQELIEELSRDYAGIGAGAEEMRDAAAAEGASTVDLDYHVPPAVAEACVRLDAVLDEADEYCRSGEHLLTMATPPRERAFRVWYLREFVRQIAGEAPTSWADYLAGEERAAG